MNVNRMHGGWGKNETVSYIKYKVKSTKENTSKQQNGG